jgi:hypothetical protein
MNKTKMNKELQRWLEESKGKVKKDKKSKEKSKKPTGMCQICGERTHTSWFL